MSRSKRARSRRRSEGGSAVLNGRRWSYVAAVYLGACLILGGASAAGAIANGVLQFLAVLLILALLWTGRAGLPREGKPVAWVVALFVVVALASLIPLPGTLWQSLPLRGEIASELRMLGIPDPALPLSLAPQATVASLLWLLPPFAIALLVVQLPVEERRRLAAVVVALAMLSILLGVFQLMGGEESPLRFYQITNRGSPVGFFANINHQATLLLCVLPCAAFLGARLATSRSDRGKRSGGAIIMGASVLLVGAGISVAGSMAGYGLFFAAAFASLLLYRRAVSKQVSARWRVALALILVVFVFGTFAGPLSQETLSTKFSANPGSRRIFATKTIDAIGDSFPVGTGLGSFVNVYRRYQDPQQAAREYTNHAHNDYLEVALELGIAGILLVLAFIFWWARRALAIWKSDGPGASLGRAGSIIVGIVLLHSLVDYPIRTSAIAALFAMACAFMIPRAPHRAKKPEADEPGAGSSLRHLEA